MKPSKFKILLRRYLDQRSTTLERHVVDKWYEELDEKGAYRDLQFEEAEVRTLEDRIISKVGRRSVRRLTYFRAMAASLAIAVLLTGLYQMYAPRPEQAFRAVTGRVHTSAMQLKKVQLPDSSVVWLNANSSVSYRLDQSSRFVTLEGEAQFSVTRNAHRPFIVSAGPLKVQVLGTDFNVKSYSSLKNVKVSVRSGKVRVSSSSGVLAFLEKNEELSVNKSTLQTRKAVIDGLSPDSWKSGIVELRKASFAELRQAVKNAYNLRLESRSASVLNGRYTLTLKTTVPEDQMLKLICKMMDRKYKKGGAHVIIY